MSALPRLLAPRLLVAGTIALVAAAARPAGAQGAAMVSGDSGRSMIVASGQARQALAPDRATLFLVVETQGGTADDAAARLAQSERAVLDTLRRLGIAAGAVQPFNYGVTPVRLMPGGPANQTVLSGRTVMRVEISRLDQLAPVTRAALARGVAVIGPPVFTATAADSVRRELLPRAIDQARRDAEVMARAAGGRLGRLIEVQATPAAGPRFGPGESAEVVYLASSVSYGFDGAPRTAPVVSAVASVTVRWELLAAPR